MKNRYIKDILLDNNIGNQEKVNGWMVGKRVYNDVVFLDVVDSTGKIQIVAPKNNFSRKEYLSISKLQIESALQVEGELKQNKRGQKGIECNSFILCGNSNLNLTPRPRDNKFNPFDTKNARQLRKHPSFYLRNPKISSALKIKSRFRHNLGSYFWEKGFTQVEPPTFTTQTLYDDSEAFWIEMNGQNVSLSRCATFHLEPSLMAYEKVFAITDSHANEMSRSNRHLAEYTHLKAEMAWVNLEDLIRIAGNTYYDVSRMTVDDCKREIVILGLKNEIEDRLEKINPKNHHTITYDEAVSLLREHNVDFEYGKSLSHSDEGIITRYFGEIFVWVKYVPCSAEGFPFRRKKDNPKLTMTCDLVAPEGYGEILGTAEKIVDYQELIERMAEKGKTSEEQMKRYQDYIDLRRYGLPEHGGIGMGIERAVRYFIKLSHIKFARPFPAVHGAKINF